MTALDDHRHLAGVTIAATCGLTGVAALLLAILGRGSAITGLCAGAGVAVLDVLMLSRGLSRFGRLETSVSGAALTGVLLGRFVSVGILLGLVMSIRSLNPVGAIVGFLLMPVSLGVIGARYARQSRVGQKGTASATR